MSVRVRARIFGFLLGAACFAGAAPLFAAPAPAGYNVVLVCFDTLRADRLGVMGYPRPVTPHLDRFARDSYLFTRAISQSAWTLPSMMSVFTSLYPHEHGIENKYSIFLEDMKELARLSPRITTIAQAFKENGYATAAFTGDAGVEGHFGFDAGFDVYFDSVTFGGFALTFPKALDWLKANREKKRRVFLFVHGYDVHGHFPLPEGFHSRFADPEYKGRFRGTREEFLDLRMKTIEGRPIEYDEADARVWKDRYDEQVLRADERFGRFLDGLDAMEGLRDDTIIAVISDHGDQFFERGGVDHGMTLNEEIIRVLLILHVPGKKARRIDSQVRLIDLMPTLIETAGLKNNPKLKARMKGVSLGPLMEGGTMRLEAFSETEYLLHTFQKSLRTSDGWKLIYDTMTQQKRLYNLREDPGETRDLFERDPARAYDLEERLLDWMLSAPPPP